MPRRVSHDPYGQGRATRDEGGAFFAMAEMTLEFADEDVWAVTVLYVHRFFDWFVATRDGDVWTVKIGWIQ